MSHRDLERQIRYYARRASRFDRSITSLGCRENRNHFRKIEAIAGFIGAGHTEVILEVGTGTGLHARWILEHTNARYVGVDASAEMLAVARRRLEGGRANLVLGDAQRLPLPDACVGAAFASGTLHHLSDPRQALFELARVLRPGGRLAVLEPNRRFPTVLAASLLLRVERSTLRISARRLRTWASEAGLAGVRVRPLLFTPPRPRRLGPLFDRVDDLLARTPGVRGLSIMLLLEAARPA